MYKTTHIIKKQVLKVTVPVSENAHSIQEQLGRICRQSLPQTLEQVCNALCAEDYWVKLDKISLNLGTLPATGLEEAIFERVAGKLTKALEARIDMGSGYDNNADIQKKSPAAPAALLTYFLITGVFPVWIDSRSISVKQLFDNDMATSPETLYRFLRHTPHKNTVGKRLSGILGYHQLKTLASGFTKTTVFNKLIDTLQQLRHQAEDALPIKEALLSYILHFDVALPPEAITKQGDLNHVIAERIKKKHVFRKDASQYDDLAIPEKNHKKDKISPGIETNDSQDGKHKDQTNPYSNPASVKENHTKSNIQQVLSPGNETHNDQYDNPKNPLSDPYDDHTSPEKDHKKDRAQPVHKDTPLPYNKNTEAQKIPVPGASIASCTIYNAGLVLLWPGIPSLLETCSLTQENIFVSEAAAERAVLLLQYAADGRTEAPEFELPLNKILCGLPADRPVATAFEPTKTEKAAVQELLKTILTEWNVLKGSSPQALRVNYLQREGTLSPEGGHWQLHIERQTADVLLDRLPWGTGVIKLPWMKHILYTTW